MSNRPISHFKELYYPSTYVFQIWLSLLAFSLFILTSLFSFKDGRLYMLGQLPDTLSRLAYGFVLLLGGIFGLATLVALISVSFVFLRSFFRVKTPSKMVSEQTRLDLLAKQINDIKNQKVMIDKFLRDVEKDNKT